MSDGNLEVVREIYAEPLPLDPELLAALDEIATADTVFDFTDAYFDGPLVTGLDGVRRIASSWPWETLYFTAERFLDVDGRRVLVFVRATATGSGSGVPVERRTAHALTFSDGTLVNFKVYSDREAALDAAGVSDRASELQWVEHSA
jgi:ketosteroid isomerase-like protein